MAIFRGNKMPGTVLEILSCRGGHEAFGMAAYGSNLASHTEEGVGTAGNVQVGQSHGLDFHHLAFRLLLFLVSPILPPCRNVQHEQHANEQTAFIHR